MKSWFTKRNGLFLILISVCWMASLAYAKNDTSQAQLYLDRTQLISEQVQLLKYRLLQSRDELNKLKREEDSKKEISVTSRAKQSLLTEARLDIAVAKSNLDSISIELAESQQTITRLTKDIQEIKNQLNVALIFGEKIIHFAALDEVNLNGELEYQQSLLTLEKKRLSNLQQLQITANQILQFYKNKFLSIEARLKAQTIMQLKQQQAQSELAFQQEQAGWLKKLNQLNDQLNQSEFSKNSDKLQHEKWIGDVFYANENVNFSYLEMLVARYQDQIQELKESLARGTNSVTLLNAMNEQILTLSKQLARVSDLLTARLTILDKRKQYHLLTHKEYGHYFNQIEQLKKRYQASLSQVNELNTELLSSRSILEKDLQQELSSRQGLPGLDAKAWLNLGGGVLLLPSLAYHVFKSLIVTLKETLETFDYDAWMWLGALEIIWICVFYSVRHWIVKSGAKLVDHEFGHVSLKWLGNQLLRRNLIDLMVVGNLIGLLYFCQVPFQDFQFVVHLSCVWLVVKCIITLAQLYLIETVHDRAGADVRLYHRLEWIFIAGGVTTALAVFVQGLPVSYEIKDIFSRLFLLFLFLISFLLLKAWEVIPGLITPHIDQRRTYLIRVVRLMGVLVPLVLIVNSAVGLCGYVNLVYQISWYEGVFLFVMVSYLVCRGILIELMEVSSTFFISHVANGWLWTEAFLKPIDRVLRIALFLSAWAWLFLFYGWDRQSPVVERLSKLIHYRFGEVLNTVITPLSVIELLVIVSFLYWAAKWTREFVYRLLVARTHDLGIRNSIAILSQYTMIVIGILIGLRVLGVDFQALAVVAGAFAVTAGFGLRDLVNNLASGFLLLIERPIRVGDLVTVEGQEGEVMHIGSRAVTVRTLDHVEFIVPNADICNKTLINWTAKDNIARISVQTKVNQTVSASFVKKLIDDVLMECPSVLKDPLPNALLKQLTDGTIEFVVHFYVNVRLIKSCAAVRSEVLLAIWNEFDKNHIKPAYPKREVHASEDRSPMTEERSMSLRQDVFT